MQGRLWSFGFGLARGFGTSELQGTPLPIETLVQYQVVQASAGGML